MLDSVKYNSIIEEVFMISIYQTVDQGIVKKDTIEDGCWINLVNPSKDELEEIQQSLDIEPDYLLAALDEEERARTERENGQTLIVVDTPIWDNKSNMYTTIPLGIIVLKNIFLTICLKEDTVINDFVSSKVKHFYTQYKTRFILQILFKNSVKFLHCLKTIDKIANNIEQELHVSMRNKELIDMLTLEKSLVFFSTSLKSNEMVLEKLLKYEYISTYSDDEDLLEDVIVENKQAIEMCNIYSSILSGTMDAFASVISNNLNIVMKVLTSLTIVMAIPNIIFGFFGMNVILPVGDSNPFGYIYVIIVTVLACLLAALVLKKKDLF